MNSCKGTSTNHLPKEELKHMKWICNFSGSSFWEFAVSYLRWKCWQKDPMNDPCNAIPGQAPSSHHLSLCQKPNPDPPVLNLMIRSYRAKYILQKKKEKRKKIENLSRLSSPLTKRSHSQNKILVVFHQKLLTKACCFSFFDKVHSFEERSKTLYALLLVLSI